MKQPPVIVVPTTQTASVFDPIALLTAVQQAAIIRPNNPPPGIGGWVMDVVQDEEINLTANITDHYTEANVAIHDNMALPPVEVQVRGLVAELLLSPTAAGAVNAPVNPPDTSLPPIVEQGPQFTPQATQTMAQTATGNALADSNLTEHPSLAQYQQTTSPQQPGQTRQSNAFGYFVQLWQGRQLFTVETPWGFFANMALKGLTGRQGKDSRYQTEFSLTFKQIRFAGSATASIGQIAGRAADYFSASNPVVNQPGNASVSSAQQAALQARWAFPSP
jgi:hypothetical protein